jgi:hypothetical protein
MAVPERFVSNTPPGSGMVFSRTLNDESKVAPDE